ncbi:MAG: hypothetical protein WC878_01415 [Candidatus Paceibacterota bacterium]|jgi:hypothetical protein
MGASVGYVPGLFAVGIASLFVLVLFFIVALGMVFAPRLRACMKLFENLILRRTMMEKKDDQNKKAAEKRAEEKPQKKPFKQPYYIRLNKDGEWDGKLRDADGNIVE